MVRKKTFPGAQRRSRTTSIRQTRQSNFFRAESLMALPHEDEMQNGILERTPRRVELRTRQARVKRKLKMHRKRRLKVHHAAPRAFQNLKARKRREPINRSSGFSMSSKLEFQKARSDFSKRNGLFSLPSYMQGAATQWPVPNGRFGDLTQWTVRHERAGLRACALPGLSVEKS